MLFFIVVCLFCLLYFICILCSYCCLLGVLNLMIGSVTATPVIDWVVRLVGTARKGLDGLVPAVIKDHCTCTRFTYDRTRMSEEVIKPNFVYDALKCYHS